MNKILFRNRSEFRSWLESNALSDDGIWLIIGKNKNIETIKASEALEEALCFGWIDGQIRSVDGDSYIKYFKKRSNTSTWSEKNKSLTQKLESQGLMTDFGRAKIEIAKRNGSWNPPEREPMSDEQVREFEGLLRSHPTAWENFEKLPPSARTAYTASYVYTKTEKGRQKRLETIIERLILNLNPMESMHKKK
jgi:uncharacterized protein YdeI (YjbR/CyaY-like superfamily)